MSHGVHTQQHGPAREPGGALRARLATAHFPLSRGAQDDIKRQVREYAAELKDLGLPPERVVVAVKQAASDAGIRGCSSVLASRRSGDPKTNLLIDIVSWCIAGYYDPPKRRRRTASAERMREPHVAAAPNTSDRREDRRSEATA